MSYAYDLSFTPAKFLSAILWMLLPTGALGQDSLYAVLKRSPHEFVSAVTAGKQSDLQKAQAIVGWLVDHLAWTATDYQKRTVAEIIERKGGNCNELATVTRSLLDLAGLRMRKIVEINLHRPSARRQESARRKIADIGNRMSVFGKIHNDHVWLEVYDSVHARWQPVDPSLGIVGERDWLRARMSFEPRVLLDSTGTDMIAPIAVFYQTEDGNLTGRTVEYAVHAFDRFYDGRLSSLQEWPLWKSRIETIESKCRDAFLGRYNLHDSEAELDCLFVSYERLKEEWGRKR